MTDPVSADGRLLPDGAPRWVNWAGNQEVYPKQILRPTTLGELRQIVAETTSRRGRLRAVATGLSFSDILQTDDTLVVLTDLKGAEGGPLLPLEEDLFSAFPEVPLVRVVCGARIREVNSALAKAGLACINLGGYDGQTLIGAISTSTHGSGITLGPLPSLVRSLDLVATGGNVYRIEPTRGPTDPARFARRYGNSRQLVQNDDWFRTAVVSMGCLGVVHSVVMEVRAAYRLTEHRRVQPWSQVKREIESEIWRHRHYEVSINPYRLRGTDGDHTCLVTRRDVAPLDAATVPLSSGRRAAETLVFLPSSERALVSVMNDEPRFLPAILESSMSALATGPLGHVDDSYRVFNLNKINGAQVLSGEYFFPLRDQQYLRALEKLFHAVEHNAAHGVYQTTPISLRFICAADAYLSMAQGQSYCSMEISAHSEVHCAAEALLSYEEICCSSGGRPHWGQLHELTGASGWLDRSYPMAGRWKDVYRRLNWAGTFDNHFTDRLGMSMGTKS